MCRHLWQAGELSLYFQPPKILVYQQLSRVSKSRLHHLRFESLIILMDLGLNRANQLLGDKYSYKWVVDPCVLIYSSRKPGQSGSAVGSSMIRTSLDPSKQEIGHHYSGEDREAISETGKEAASKTAPNPSESKSDVSIDLGQADEVGKTPLLDNSAARKKARSKGRPPSRQHLSGARKSETAATSKTGPNSRVLDNSAGRKKKYKSKRRPSTRHRL